MRLTEPRAFRERTSFVGRSRERARVQEELVGGAGLLTIVGPSGMGKTRLALTVGADLAPTFQEGGGVWFCSLANCSDAADAEAVIARTLGIVEWTPGELEIALAQRRRTLLILDNSEWIASELGALISPWLVNCTDLQLLVTSIVPLEIEGETRLELGPLKPDDAVALYLDRARQASAGFELAAMERSAVRELVQRLDGIPLAIELAAARVRVLPPRILLQQFGSRMQLLRSKGGGRHGSWVEALAITWELLTDEERTILSRATIFAGGFTLEAATAVLGIEGADPQSEVLDLLDGLRGKALLLLDEGAPDIPPRFILLESIHAFAEQKLQEAGGDPALVERHATHYVEQGERDLGRLEGNEYVAAIRSLIRERDNLEQALRRSQERHPALAARAGHVLNRLSSIHGYPPSERPIIEATLQSARRAGDPRLIAWALADQVESLSASPSNEEAAATIAEAIEAARVSGEWRAEIRVGLGHARILHHAGEMAAAKVRFGEVIALARRHGAPALEGLALLALIYLHLNVNEADDAERLFHRLEELLQAHDLPGVEARAIHAIAGLHFLRSNFREARRGMEEALRRNAEIGNPLRAGNIALGQALIEAAAGRPDEAEARALAALGFAREVANQRGIGYSLALLGTFSLHRRAWEEAEDRLSEAVSILGHAGDLVEQAKGLPYLAVAEAKLGRLEEAEQTMEEVRAMVRMGYEAGAKAQAIANVLEGCLELVRAGRLLSEDPSGAEALVRQARGRLQLAEDDGPGHLLTPARKLLEQELADWERHAPQPSRSPAGELRVGADAGWFELDGGERVDLSKRSTLRGMLRALVEQRIGLPGVGIHALDLFSHGWPNDRIKPDLALKRVYIGIWTLRRLGLASILWSRSDGYLLAPTVQIQRVPS